MKVQITIIFLAVLLAACTPSQSIPVDAQNTAMVVVQTYIALTQTALPTPVVLPTATPPATLIPTLPPPPIITPDAVQVERWQEYEAALAKSILPMFDYMVLCEWDILGRSEQEVYVWAACRAPGGDDSRPAVIRLGIDGAIQEVEVLKRSASSNVDELFPKEVQEKFNFYVQMYGFDGRLRELYDHLIYRETHPETPPLIVLSSYTPIPPTSP
ncbi:hypothetical protein FBQ83_06710 [Chloroflexi bacterium CFX5]|nr:hypothetical protein [Chloroflexota bacterium]MDL1919000.1 hypothetical protein [Chloroflexi bacterium CFX5]